MIAPKRRKIGRDRQPTITVSLEPLYTVYEPSGEVVAVNVSESLAEVFRRYPEMYRLEPQSGRFE